MKPTKVIIGVVVVLVVLALIVGSALLSGYNQAVGLDENVKKQWAQVENQLQRRFDLIPNLEASVKGTALQEQTVFLGIAKARESYLNAKTVEEKAEAASALESGLIKVLALAEAYPELKSNEAFLKLQDAIEGTENRLSVARKEYNDTAETLNQFVRQFPGRIYASLAGVQQAKYFEPEDGAKERPKVDFSDLKE